jgi:hypothetical protein
VRRSLRRWPERALAILAVYPYRCEQCGGRFYSTSRARKS